MQRPLIVNLTKTHDRSDSFLKDYHHIYIVKCIFTPKPCKSVTAIQLCVIIL